MKGAWAVLLAACASTGGGPSPTASTSSRPAATASVVPDALRMDHRSVRSIELRRGKERVRLAREDDGWWVVEPLRDRAHEAAVDDLLAVLHEIEVLGPAEGGLDSLWVEGPEAIAVRVAGSRGDRAFRIGRGEGRETFVSTDRGALRARGRFRRFFARSLDELRDPTITDIPLEAIERVEYDNPSGTLSLVASPEAPRSFVAEPPIEDFYAERAVQQIAVAAHLTAKGFVAAPPPDAGLGEEAATVAIHRRDGSMVEIRLGRREGRRAFLRTSSSDRTYLVSAHLRSSLLAHRAQLHASPATAASAHDHDHEAPAQKVPPAMLHALRRLARAQRGE